MGFRQWEIMQLLSIKVSGIKVKLKPKLSLFAMAIFDHCINTKVQNQHNYKLYVRELHILIIFKD